MERKAPSKARLFVALDLPDDAREAVVAWQGEAFGAQDPLRLVRPEALHMTLVFLGHHPVEEIDAIGAAAFSALEGLEAPAFEPVAVKPIPPGRRARLFAVDLADACGRGAAVQAAVEGPLAEGGWYEPEKRPFWPHITVARVRARERPPRVDVGPPDTGEFVASEVVLYRSKLGRGGAEYRALARMTLP